MKTRLKDKYLRGETSPREEQQLLSLLEAEVQPTADDLALKAMLKAAPPQAESDWLTEDESALYDQLLLTEAIEQLTPSQRRLFQLKQSPEMDINQMAQLTGMKPRSVSAKLSEARRRLHEYIKRKM